MESPLGAPHPETVPGESPAGGLILIKPLFVSVYCLSRCLFGGVDSDQEISEL
jgi:hypothetical protein